MKSAPPVAHAVAKAMQQLLGDDVKERPALTYLEADLYCKSGGTRQISGASPTKCDVIVVSNTGNCIKEAMLHALSICASFGQPAVSARNWRQALIGEGFSRNPQDEDNFSNIVVALTDLMSEKLTDHFEFAFSGGGVAPVVYGGLAGDGSIVGVLSSRMDGYTRRQHYVAGHIQMAHDIFSQASAAASTGGAWWLKNIDTSTEAGRELANALNPLSLLP